MIRGVVAGLTFACLSTFATFPALAQTTFYEASEADLPGAPGTLIRKEPMLRSPDGGVAYRMLYRSTGLRGKPIPVSGVVIVPQSPAPPGGRPIIAWAHPTTGVVPHCAPSLALFVFQQIQGLREMLEQGYIVVATDYPAKITGVRYANARGERGAALGSMGLLGRDKLHSPPPR